MSLNIAATPPPFLFVVETFIELEFGGADSMRTGVLLLLSNQVLVKIIKTMLRRKIID